MSCSLHIIMEDTLIFRTCDHNMGFIPLRYPHYRTDVHEHIMGELELCLCVPISLDRELPAIVLVR